MRSNTSAWFAMWFPYHVFRTIFFPFLIDRFEDDLLKCYYRNSAVRVLIVSIRRDITWKYSFQIVYYFAERILRNACASVLSVDVHIETFFRLLLLSLFEQIISEIFFFPHIFLFLFLELQWNVNFALILNSWAYRVVRVLVHVFNRFGTSQTEFDVFQFFSNIISGPDSWFNVFVQDRRFSKHLKRQRTNTIPTKSTCTILKIIKMW